MTYGMQADGPVHGLGADFDLYSSIHQEVRIGVAVSRAVRAERIAERERCAKVADSVAAQYEIDEKGCWDEGDGACEGCKVVAMKIRSGE